MPTDSSSSSAGLTLGGAFRTVEPGSRGEIEQILQRRALFARFYLLEFGQQFRVVRWRG